MASQRVLRSSLRMAEIISGNTTLAIIGTTDGLAVGDRVKGPGIPAGVTITAVAATNVTLSAAPTATANQQVSFEGNGLANPGSSATGAYPSVRVPDDSDALAFEFEVVGGTSAQPKFQASLDGPDVLDANSDWIDLEVLPSDSAVETAAPAAQTPGVKQYTVELARRGPISKVRLNVVANTGSTFEGDVQSLHDE